METLFACYDIAEDMFAAARELQEPGFMIKRSIRNRLYDLDTYWKGLKKIVRDTEMTYQEQFGDRSEYYKELILRLSDIALTDTSFLDEIMNKVKEKKPYPGLNTYIFKI